MTLERGSRHHSRSPLKCILTRVCYSQLQIGWHRILRLFLKTFNLVPGVPGFIISYLILIVNPMGRILVRWKSFRNNLEILSTLSAIGCTLISNDAATMLNASKITYTFEKRPMKETCAKTSQKRPSMMQYRWWRERRVACRQNYREYVKINEHIWKETCERDLR